MRLATEWTTHHTKCRYWDNWFLTPGQPRRSYQGDCWRNGRRNTYANVTVTVTASKKTTQCEESETQNLVNTNAKPATLLCWTPQAGFWKTCSPRQTSTSQTPSNHCNYVPCLQSPTRPKPKTYRPKYNVDNVNTTSSPPHTHAKPRVTARKVIALKAQDENTMYQNRSNPAFFQTGNRFEKG